MRQMHYNPAYTPTPDLATELGWQPLIPESFYEAASSKPREISAIVRQALRDKGVREESLSDADVHTLEIAALDGEVFEDHDDEHGLFDQLHETWDETHQRSLKNQPHSFVAALEAERSRFGQAQNFSMAS